MMMELILVSAFIAAFVVAYALTERLIPRLIRAGITGGDENKEGAPQTPEMGGLAIVAGFTAGLLLMIYFSSFAGTFEFLGFRFDLAFNMTFILAALITIHSIAFIGVVDDLLNIPQWLKAFSPLLAAAPLVAMKVAGSTAIGIPFVGLFDFGLVYLFVLVPLAIAVCSNLTNMLAGFNGMETGMGLVMFVTLAILGWSNGSMEMTILSLSMAGALAGFLIFNRFPAKVFPGDVGTLTIGVALASTIIIGNLESAGVILMIPYIIDFFIKAKNRFPHTHQELRGGKLYPKDGKVKGLVHIMMKAFGGLSERRLVIYFMALESVFAIIALALFLKR
jgi:UDP-N-acetylglucosamine--dolichyl-phosphate N-acetylglucosaminephosphotransferase